MKVAWVSLARDAFLAPALLPDFGLRYAVASGLGVGQAVVREGNCVCLSSPRCS